MPSITDSQYVGTGFSNLFGSPYGQDGVIPVYSSVPIPNLPSGTCLPCVVCGTSQSRSDILTNSQAANSNLTVSANSVSYTTTINYP